MAENPVRAIPRIHRSGAEPGENCTDDSGRVGHPPVGGGAPGHEEAEQHRDRAAQVQPVRQGVEAGERHVGRAHLQRQDVVGQPAEGEGPGEQVQHQAAVHGEQRVVLLEAQQRAVGAGQLRADATAP